MGLILGHRTHHYVYQRYRTEGRGHDVGHVPAIGRYDGEPPPAGERATHPRLVDSEDRAYGRSDFAPTGGHAAASSLHQNAAFTAPCHCVWESYGARIR